MRATIRRCSSSQQSPSPDDRLEGRMLLAPAARGTSRSREPNRAVMRSLAATTAPHHVPPGKRRTVDQPRRDIDGKRRPGRLQDREGLGKIVAVSVVESQDDEPPSGRSASEPPRRLVEIDDVDVALPQPADDGGEEVGSDVEMRIGSESSGTGAADVMKHQDRADTLRHGPDEPVRIAPVKGVQRRLESDRGQFIHGRSGVRLAREPGACGPRASLHDDVNIALTASAATRSSFRKVW